MDAPVGGLATAETMRWFRFHPRRLLVLVAAVLSFVGGYLAEVSHVLDQAHVVCAEHGGQLEDASARPARGHGAGVAADTAAERHRPCAMPAAFAPGGQAVLRVPPAMARAETPAPAPVTATAPDAPRLTLPTLAYSPKSGPPQV